MRALLERLQQFFSGWAFPALVLTVLACFEMLMGAMLVVPASSGAFGAFADEFRTWCFGYDPATGTMQWAYAAMMLAHPLVIGSLIATLWRSPLSDARRNHKRGLFACAGGGLSFVTVAVLAMTSLSRGAPAAELPFPAEALRVAHQAPAIELTDQDGTAVSLARLRGKVVIVTGMYATCGHTCPRIMAQIRSALDSLSSERRRDVRVLAVTLDPSHDDQQVMAAAARRYEVSAPEYHLLSGPETQVNRILDQLEIARVRDMSGVINHANLFIVVDREGRIAYRFSLGERQQRWLTTALNVLLAESSGAGGA